MSEWVLMEIGYNYVDWPRMVHRNGRLS